MSALEILHRGDVPTAMFSRSSRERSPNGNGAGHLAKGAIDPDAFDVVGRNAILHDPGYCGGQYYDPGTPSAGPVVGLALARMLAHNSRDNLMQQPTIQR